LRPPASACQDLKVFPEGRAGPASQVSPQTTATHRRRDAPSWHAPPRPWAPPLPLQPQLCCPGRMLSEIM
ncbi:unnamed protein product, partial [Gulo gulo]